jgi:hypothetical protein
MTTNFQPNFMHENGIFGFFNITAAKVGARLYSKVWPMLSIFDSNKQKTPLEISVVFDRWGAVL